MIGAPDAGEGVPILLSRVRDSFYWVAGGRFAAQLINWWITLWVIGLLSPADYGLIAMAMVFVSALSLVDEFGLGAMIVRVADLDETALRKSFGIVLALNGALSAALLLGAPAVGWFYGSAELVPLVRLLALQFLGSSLAVLPRALMQRGLAFRRLASGEVITSLVGSLVTLMLALKGYGVWALAIGSVVLPFLGAGIFHVLCSCPRLPIFSAKGMGEFLRFGGTVSLERVLWYVYSQADILIAGKLLGTEALGLYVIGKYIASLPAEKISPVIQQIVFPAFAQIQSDRDRVARTLLRGVNAVSVFVCPVLFGIAAVGGELIATVLGEKWAAASLPMATYSLVVPLGMVSGIVLSALKAVGRADLSLKNVALGACLMTAAFVVGSAWGLVGLSLAWVVAYPVYFLATAIRSAEILGTRPRALISRVLGPMAAGALMLAVVVLLRHLTQETLSSAPVRLTMLVGVGVAVYGAVMLTLGRTPLLDALSLVRPTAARPEPSLS